MDYEGMDEKAKERAMEKLEELKAILAPSGMSVAEFEESCGEMGSDKEESKEPEMEEEASPKKGNIALIIAKMNRKRGM